MKHWDEKLADIEKITPDFEKATSLLALVELRQKDLVSKEKTTEFATLVVESYYEIIKELLTAIMSIDGYKTLSHEILVSYLETQKHEITTAEMFLADQLRKTRNDIAYRGIKIPVDYLSRNQQSITVLIKKLKKILLLKLNNKLK